MITDCLLTQTDPVWLLITITEFALALLFMRPLELRDPGRGRQVALGAVALILWYGVHLLHPGFVLDFALNILVLFAYVRAARRTNNQQALYVSCIFVLCTEVGKILCVDFFMQPLNDFFAAQPSFVVTLVWAAVSQLVALGCLLLVSRWVFNGSMNRLSGAQSLFVLLPLVPYAYVRNSEFLYTMYDDTTMYWNMVWLTVLLSVVTLLVVVGNAHNLSQLVEKNEYIRMQSLLKEQHAQYMALKGADETMRRRYHDLKHYLNELEALRVSPEAADAAELGEFAARLREELAPYERDIETGNQILDVLLAEKRAACLNRGIRPVFYTDGRDLDFVSSFDLCAIFGNLLDNAIEATECLGGDATHEILVDIRRSRGLVVIQCRNVYGGSLRNDEHGDFATTKRDAEKHGYGLKSVRSTAESYGGSMSVATDGGVFAVTVILPVPVTTSSVTSALGLDG